MNSKEKEYNAADFIFGSWVLSGCFEVDGSAKVGCARCNLTDARIIPYSSSQLAYALKQIRETEGLPEVLDVLRFDKYTCINFDLMIDAMQCILSAFSNYGNYELSGMSLNGARSRVSDMQEAIQFGHKLRKTLYKIENPEEEESTSTV